MFYDLYCPPHIIRVIKSGRMRWAGHATRMGERGGAYRVLVGISEEKRLFRRPMRRGKDNIKMHLREVIWGVMDRIELAQDRGHDGRL